MVVTLIPILVVYVIVSGNFPNKGFLDQPMYLEIPPSPMVVGIG